VRSLFSSIKFGIRIPPCTRIDEVAATVRRAEEHGFDYAWIPDSQMLWRDTYAAMALAAAQTESITLATGVTNVRTRNPAVVASAINTIAEIAPGRVALGMGAGDSSVKLISVAPSTRAHLRESVSTIRRLLDGEMVTFGERAARLYRAQGRVPIYLAANGPRTLELAGEIADGIITLGGIAPAPLIAARNAVERGLARAGRKLDDLEFTVGSICRVTDDIERDARILKPVCLHIAGIGGQASLAQAGIELDPPRRLPKVYPDLVHAEDWDLAIQEASEYVTDDMAVKFAQTFCLFGTVDEILARMKRAIEIGATAFCLRNVGTYTLPHELIEAFGSEILPRLGRGHTKRAEGSAR